MDYLNEHIVNLRVLHNHLLLQYIIHQIHLIQLFISPPIHLLNINFHLYLLKLKEYTLRKLPHL